MSEKHRLRNECIRIKVTKNEKNYRKDKASCCTMNLSEYGRDMMMDGYIIMTDLIDKIMNSY